MIEIEQHITGITEHTYFRFHRGLYEDAMKTKVIVENIEQLKLCLYFSGSFGLSYWYTPYSIAQADVNLRFIQQGIDKRNGMYSTMVLMQMSDGPEYPYGNLMSPTPNPLGLCECEMVNQHEQA